MLKQKSKSTADEELTDELSAMTNSEENLEGINPWLYDVIPPFFHLQEGNFVSLYNITSCSAFLQKQDSQAIQEDQACLTSQEWPQSVTGNAIRCIFAVKKEILYY